VAEDSIREQILDFIFEQLLELKAKKDPVLAYVHRGIMDEVGLNLLAATQFPAACLAGYLPMPTPHNQGRAPGSADRFISELRAQIMVYGREVSDPDIWISSIADDLWAKLHESPTKGNLLSHLRIDFADATPRYQRPYTYFTVTIYGTYTHGTGGI
jgi:hypothetical protein